VAVAVAIAPLAAAMADPSAARESLLVAGLAPRGELWLAAPEVRLRRALDSLEGLEKRCVAAQQRVQAMLDLNERNRAQLLQAEIAQARKGAPPQPAPAPSNPSSAAPAASADGRLNSRMSDVTGPPGVTPLQTALIEWIAARNALACKVLAIQRDAALIGPAYAALKKNSRVTQALAERGKRERLGPAKNYQRDVARAVSSGRLAFTSDVPVYVEGDRFRVGVIINESTPATMTYAAGSGPCLLSANTAELVGVEARPAEPLGSVAVGARTLRGQPGVIASLRFGKHVFQNIPAFILVPEDEDAGSQLSVGALEGYSAELHPRQMSLKLKAVAH